MKTVADIMTRNVISVQDDDNLQHARMLFKQCSIRHFLVVDVSGAYRSGTVMFELYRP